MLAAQAHTRCTRGASRCNHARTSHCEASPLRRQRACSRCTTPLQVNTPRRHSQSSRLSATHPSRHRSGRPQDPRLPTERPPRDGRRLRPVRRSRTKPRHRICRRSCQGPTPPRAQPPHLPAIVSVSSSHLSVCAALALSVNPCLGFRLLGATLLRSLPVLRCRSRPAAAAPGQGRPGLGCGCGLRLRPRVLTRLRLRAAAAPARADSPTAAASASAAPAAALTAAKVASATVPFPPSVLHVALRPCLRQSLVVAAAVDRQGSEAWPSLPALLCPRSFVGHCLRRAA